MMKLRVGVAQLLSPEESNQAMKIRSTSIPTCQSSIQTNMAVNLNREPSLADSFGSPECEESTTRLLEKDRRGLRPGEAHKPFASDRLAQFLGRGRRPLRLWQRACGAPGHLGRRAGFLKTGIRRRVSNREPTKPLAFFSLSVKAQNVQCIQDGAIALFDVWFLGLVTAWSMGNQHSSMA